LRLEVTFASSDLVMPDTGSGTTRWCHGIDRLVDQLHEQGILHLALSGNEFGHLGSAPGH
jgi:hypothetical protein